MNNKINWVIMILASLFIAYQLNSSPAPLYQQKATVIASPFTAFCKGFHEGYQAGYCYQKEPCLPPLPVLCPLARVGETTYKHGYNRGFVAGKEYRNEE